MVGISVPYTSTREGRWFVQWFNGSFELGERTRQIKHWLAESDSALNAEVKKQEGSGVGVSMLSLVLFFICLIITAATVDKQSYIVAGITGAISLLSIVTAFAFLGRYHRSTDRLRATKRKELEAIRNQDPFYQRARLIAEANEGFEAHAQRYLLYNRQVHEELRKADEQLERGYLELLTRAEQTIIRACRNFQQTIDLSERRKKFEREHPEVHIKPEDTALSDLMARLDEPANIPQASELPDPAEALEYEEALRELDAELHDEHRL